MGKNTEENFYFFAINALFLLSIQEYFKLLCVYLTVPKSGNLTFVGDLQPLLIL